MAASYAASHLVWTRQAIIEFSAETPVCQLMADNDPAMALIRDYGLTRRSEHVNVHFYFVRERFVEGEYQPCLDRLWSSSVNRSAWLADSTIASGDLTITTVLIEGTVESRCYSGNQTQLLLRGPQLWKEQVAGKQSI